MRKPIQTKRVAFYLPLPVICAAKHLKHVSNSKGQTLPNGARNFRFLLVFNLQSAIFLSMRVACSCSVPIGLLVAVAMGSVPTYAGAQDSVSKADNTPYANIVARNVFGLLPIPPPAPVSETPPADPPPKITPNGIMTIFGREEALFKVAEKPKPGQPAKEVSHVMGEGEMEDEITVVKINHVDGIITFNNHGTIQELPLVAAKEPTSPPPGVPPPRNPFLPGAMPPPAAAGFQRQIPRPMGPGGGGTQEAAGTPPTGSLPLEDQVMNTARNMAIIEQNRIATQDLVDQGKMPPLPPTLLTPPDSHVGDSPLVGAEGLVVPNGGTTGRR
jgi:hypothetical protein